MGRPSSFLCSVYSVWCVWYMVCCARCVVYVAWCMVYGALGIVYTLAYLLCDVWCVVCVVWCMVHGVCNKDAQWMPQLTTLVSAFSLGRSILKSCSVTYNGRGPMSRIGA